MARNIYSRGRRKAAHMGGQARWDSKQDRVTSSYTIIGRFLTVIIIIIAGGSNEQWEILTFTLGIVIVIPTRQYGSRNNNGDAGRVHLILTAQNFGDANGLLD
eukprot:scaffold1485_cov171-Amphora_coffeaeformis.AAC.3